LPANVIAQTAPDQSVVALKYFDYRDWQPGADRMTVRSPSLYLLRPLTESLSLEGTLVYDSMSGASPLAFDTLSGASGIGITDYRKAGDVKLTRYFDRVAVGVGGAYSRERDYISRAITVEARTWTDDKNRTYAFGVSAAPDHIHPHDRTIDDGRRDTLDFLFGVTQAVNADAIVQSNLTYSTGHGYYSDPYKLADLRPDHRRILAWLTRWNQYLPSLDATPTARELALGRRRKREPAAVFGPLDCRGHCEDLLARFDRWPRRRPFVSRFARWRRSTSCSFSRRRTRTRDAPPTRPLRTSRGSRRSTRAIATTASRRESIERPVRPRSRSTPKPRRCSITRNKSSTSATGDSTSRRACCGALGTSRPSRRSFLPRLRSKRCAR
jgi:hypothetical protein